jgi:hypothetical protein
VRDASDVEVDLAALERDTLGPEPLPLLLPHREAAVGADDAPPRDVIGVPAGREEAGGEARSAGRDVAVGADEPLRDRPDRGDDLGVAVGGDA